MCYSPIRIKNPFIGLQNVGYNFLHDCTAQYIEVPCGHCASCIAIKQSYAIQRAQMEALGNDLFMCTLTYSPKMIRSYVINGYELKYADITDVQNMMKRLRKRMLFGPSGFSYFCVSEYGGKRHRPHFHILFSVPKVYGETVAERDERTKYYHDQVLKEWRRNVATTIAKKDTARYKAGEIIPNTRCPEYRPLCKYIKYYRNGKLHTTYDFHYVDPYYEDAKGKVHDTTDVAFYVTKYLTKSSKYVDRLKSALKLNLDAEDFAKYWPIFRPKALVSKDWGDPKNPLVAEHIRDGIASTLESATTPYPVFINPTTGQTFPLAPFYRKKFVTLQDALTYYYAAEEAHSVNDNFRIKDTLDRMAVDKIIDKQYRFKLMQEIISGYDNSDTDACIEDMYEDDKVYDITTEDEWIDEVLDSNNLMSMCTIDIGLQQPEWTEEYERMYTDEDKTILYE